MYVCFLIFVISILASLRSLRHRRKSGIAKKKKKEGVIKNHICMLSNSR